MWFSEVTTRQWVPRRRVWDAPFSPLDEARSLGPAALSHSCVADPGPARASSDPLTPSPRLPWPPALCQHWRFTSRGSNGSDPTAPFQRKGCLQHPQAAWGIPASPAPPLQ